MRPSMVILRVRFRARGAKVVGLTSTLATSSIDDQSKTDDAVLEDLRSGRGTPHLCLYNSC